MKKISVIKRWRDRGLDINDYIITDKGALYLTDKGVKKALEKVRRQLNEH